MHLELTKGHDAVSIDRSPNLFRVPECRVLKKELFSTL